MKRGMSTLGTLVTVLVLFGLLIVIFKTFFPGISEGADNINEFGTCANVPVYDPDLGSREFLQALCKLNCEKGEKTVQGYGCDNDLKCCISQQKDIPRIEYFHQTSSGGSWRPLIETVRLDKNKAYDYRILQVANHEMADHCELTLEKNGEEIPEAMDALIGEGVNYENIRCAENVITDWSGPLAKGSYVLTLKVLDSSTPGKKINSIKATVVVK